MSTTSASPKPLNLLTPMAFLTPVDAFQVTIAAYIFVGCSGVISWDFLSSLKSDYRLLFKHRIRLPTVAYFMSRLASLGYVYAATVFQTAPIGNCDQFEQGLAWLYTMAITFTSLLFFLRVRAIFERNRYITAFFGLMWLAVLGGCLTTTQGDTAGEIGPTKYCINISFAGYVTVSAVVPLVNDTLVFLAISWRLIKNQYVEDDIKVGLQAIILGDHLPALSRALFKDGQIYYLTTVITNLSTLIMLYIKPVPVVYRTMFTVPNVMLMNIMACRVFRNTRLGSFPDNASGTFITPISRDERNDTHSQPPFSLVFSKCGREDVCSNATATAFNVGASVIDV